MPRLVRFSDNSAPPVLPDDSEPSRNILDDITRESSNTEHLPHRLRRPRGFGVAHGGHGRQAAGGVSLLSVSITFLHEACAWVEADYASLI